MDADTLKKEFGTVFFTEEKTFGGIVVFLHSGIANFLKLIDSVYKESPVKQIPINLGFFMSGVGKFDNKTRVYLVWANEKMRPDPISAVPSFVHEISHMVDTILVKAGVNDSAGETRAYLMERYTMFIMHKLGLLKASELEEGKIDTFQNSIEEELKNKTNENYEQVRKTINQPRE